MGTTGILQRSVLVLALAGLLVSYGLAGERAPATNESSSSNDMSAALSPTLGEQSTDLVRASRVMGAKIKSPDGTTLGHVSDLVLTPDLDSVAYVAMSRGGVFGMGNLMYAVPWSALSSGVNGSFVVPVTESQLEQSRGFDQDNWPSRPSAGWMAQDQQHLYGAPDTNGSSVFPRRFTRLRGTNVTVSEGDKAGDIRDFVIAKDTGRIAYTIVSHGGLLGMGQKLAAIPQSAITLEPALGTARVNASKAVVQANSFTPGRWPGLTTPSYSQQLARAYNIESAETTLAYVPPDETTAVARAPRSTTTPSTRSTTPPVSDKTSAMMAEPKADELTATFDASNIKTIDGTVVAVGKFQPASGSEMLWLRVRPETGQPVLVNLGPRTYIGTQDFYIVPGDRIHLSGAQVKAAASGKQVFLPTEVRYEGQTLRLRSATGTPLWEGRTGTAGSSSTAPQTQSKAESSETPPLGYAPAEDEDSATTANRSGTSPSAAPSATPAEPSSDELTGRYNPSAITSIDGTVMDAGKVRGTGAESNQDMLWLRVRTNEGRTVLVNLGPRNYVSGQDFYIVRGDRIHLRGSEAATTAAGRQVFLPTEVTYNNHTLRLRSATGTPLWEGRTGTMEPSTSSETQSKDQTAGTPPLGYTPSEPADSTGTHDAAGKSELDTMDKNMDKNADTSRTDREPVTEPNGNDIP